MTQQAKVERVLEGQEAVISVRRRSACASDCESCHGCAHPEETIEVTAYNAAGAAPGDHVTVESGTAQVLGLAGLLYIMPVVLMIGGYFLASGVGETAGVLASLLGLGLGLAICGVVSRRLRRRGQVSFRIVSIEHAERLQ